MDKQTSETWSAIEEESKLRAAMTLLGLLPYCHDGMVAYIISGQRVGGFLITIIENDLLAAAVVADELNAPKLREWALFLMNHAPRACHGSPLAYKEWRKAGGLEGIKALAEQGEAA